MSICFKLHEYATILTCMFPSKKLLLTSPFAVVFIGSAIFALQQLSGINAVFYFSSTVFKNAGVPSDFANICVGIANLSGNILLYSQRVYFVNSLLFILITMFMLL